MTVKELRDRLDAMIDGDATLADLSVTVHVAGEPPVVGRAYYGVVHRDSDEGCFQIVAQPKDWRFGRPDSPAALRATSEKAEG